MMLIKPLLLAGFQGRKSAFGDFIQQAIGFRLDGVGVLGVLSLGGSGGA
jgi:hypothetical protein